MSLGMPGAPLLGSRGFRRDVACTRCIRGHTAGPSAGCPRPGRPGHSAVRLCVQTSQSGAGRAPKDSLRDITCGVWCGSQTRAPKSSKNRRDGLLEVLVTGAEKWK